MILTVLWFTCISRQFLNEDTYHRNILLLKWGRMATEVKGGRTIVTTDQVASFATSIAAIMIVAFPWKTIEYLTS